MQVHLTTRKPPDDRAEEGIYLLGAVSARCVQFWCAGTSETATDILFDKNLLRLKVMPEDVDDKNRNLCVESSWLPGAKDAQCDKSCNEWKGTDGLQEGA